jgi:hypothetical protein
MCDLLFYAVMGGAFGVTMVATLQLWFGPGNG